MTIDEVVEFDDLNKEAEETQDPEEATKIIKWYEDIIKTKKRRDYKRRISSRTNFLLKKKKSLLGFTKAPSFLKLMFLNWVKNMPNYLSLLQAWSFLKTIIRTLKQFAINMKKIFNFERVYLLKLSL